MARIRTIKPDFFRHGRLFDAEKETGLPLRVAFAGLWTAADREGRFEWSPRELKLDALPYDEVDFSRVLDALWTRGHISKYTSGGRYFGFIPSWHEHQVINNRESASVLPDPEESSMVEPTCTREPRVIDASSTPLVHAQVEGKGREGKGRRVNDALSDGFNAFWAVFPNHKARQDAEKAWVKLKPNAELQAFILKAVAMQSQGEDWRKEGGRFVPHAATWLNGKRWTDEGVKTPDLLTVGDI